MNAQSLLSKQVIHLVLMMLSSAKTITSVHNQESLPVFNMHLHSHAADCAQLLC